MQLCRDSDVLFRTANGTSSLRAMSKSNSASSLIHGNNNGHVDNVAGGGQSVILFLNRSSKKQGI